MRLLCRPLCSVRNSKCPASGPGSALPVAATASHHLPPPRRASPHPPTHLSPKALLGAAAAGHDGRRTTCGTTWLQAAGAVAAGAWKHSPPFGAVARVPVLSYCRTRYLQYTRPRAGMRGGCGPQGQRRMPPYGCEHAECIHQDPRMPYEGGCTTYAVLHVWTWWLCHGSPPNPSCRPNRTPNQTSSSRALRSWFRRRACCRTMTRPAR